jgi:hypothetical protein
MPRDVLSSFGCLDDLIQVIYQSVHQFVVLSSVSDVWTVHLGLADPEGRWWCGSWKEDDILHVVVRTLHLSLSSTLHDRQDVQGSKPSNKLLKTFAEKLAETFIKGELYVGDWDARRGATIKVIPSH